MRPFLIAGLTGLLCLSIHVTAHAETEEERKAIEEIERKAEAEKKKALEKIRKKAEAEKKKAVAEAKKEEAKRKREEAEAKKKAEREAKKQEAQRKKAEAEAKKRGEPPPPPPAEAPPVTPEVVPPPAPAPAAPPPEPLPEAKPVDNAGGARWTGIGFVQQGEATPGQQSAAGGAGALEVPPAMGALGMNRGYFMFGLGRARFNPINDGTTDDDTAFSLLDLNLRLGFEFRNLGSLLAPWFDLGPNLMFGSREETNPSTGSTTGRKFSVFSMQWHGRFGMDFAPIDLFSGGPYVGYRFELWSVKLASDSCVSCSSESGIMHGLMYGLHARFRTRAKPGEAERFYVDGVYGWRKGEYQTTSHLELEAAVRAGPIFFLGWYETRLGSSGRFEPGDVSDIGEATAASMPIDQRLGLGMAAIF